MARLFTELIFDGTVRGTTEVFTSAKWNARLGEADDTVFEIEVSETAGTSVTLTLRYLHCCSGEDAGFKLANTLTSGAESLASLPYREIKLNNGTFAAFGKVGITLGGTSPVARIRIWVTGRVD